ncbi:hypothetical protein L798_08308 [Zootermopsis nevadensis]|uniref:Uncharacterized protein n=1 Tax=Zootermopsis nevadensis TaxID=136037 RepID=A0A067R2Q8_ZOONE|nr:hypothetical protein L798_08308 [Zootermopsis nevadensis]
MSTCNKTTYEGLLNILTHELIDTTAIIQLTSRQQNAQVQPRQHQSSPPAMIQSQLHPLAILLSPS